MKSIPWFADIEALSGVEFAFLIFMVLIACWATGFIIHAIMRDAGFGPATNGVFALAGAWAGIYLRYRLLAPYRADDLLLTIGFAVATVFVLFLTLALVKSRIF